MPAREQPHAVIRGPRLHAELTVDVLRKFRLIYGSVRQHFREVEEICGVSGSQLWVMHELRQSPGIGVTELARRLSIHQTTCSQLIDKLVSRGYVRKARSTEDQRRVGLTLSSRAAKVLASAPGPAEGVLPQALMDLSGETLESLSTHLDRLIAHLRLADVTSAGKPLADL